MNSDEREEGEMSDDSMSVDEDPPPSLSLKPIFDSGGNTDFLLDDLPDATMIKLEKVDIAVLEEKAKEFGILLAVGQKDIDDLYESIGVDDAIERHIQFDTIHMKGVETMKKNDIFFYLKDYEPVTVEKITESSCNITFKDHIAACLAILVHSQDIVDEKVKSDLTRSSAKHYWREGLPQPNCKLILMRFATKSDVIASTKNSARISLSNKKYCRDGRIKNPWGELCMAWGINDHQEVYGPKLPPISYIKTDAGIIKLDPQIPYDYSLRPRLINRNLAKRLGKRQHMNMPSDEESNSDDDWKIKSKVPRMRMRADDEEEKRKPQNSGGDKKDIEDEYPSLSIQIDNVIDDDTGYNPDKTPLSHKFSMRLQSKSKGTKSTIAPQKPKPSVHSRLGIRVEETESKLDSDGELSEDSISSYKESHLMSRVHKIPTKITLQSVWTRLEKPDAKKQHTGANTIKLSGCSDLRKKLKDKKRSPLRVEIDNEYYGSD